MATTGGWPSFVPTVPPASPRERTYIAALRAEFGEHGVAWVGFAVLDAATPDWLFRHTLEGTRLDLGPLLLSGQFGDAAPALARGVDPDRMASFTQVSPPMLAGSLAEMLVAGGVHRTRSWTARRALELAFDFVGGLGDDRLDDLFVAHSRIGWSDWFGHEVWDRTWAIADRGTDRIWLLCVTGRTRPLPR